MSAYEWWRIILAVGQFIATLVAPFVIVYVDRKWKRYVKKKRGGRPRGIKRSRK